MPLAAPLRLARAPSTRVVLPDGREITVPPATIRQIEDALRLDPPRGAGAPPETALERAGRLRGQTAALLGPAHAPLADELTERQCLDLSADLYLAACGYDPAQWRLFRAVSARREDRRESLEILVELQEVTLTLAAELRRTPAEAAETPLADALALAARLAKLADARTRWEAALHGARI